MRLKVSLEDGEYKHTLLIDDDIMCGILWNYITQRVATIRKGKRSYIFRRVEGRWKRF